jgi:hypothetical protein
MRGFMMMSLFLSCISVFEGFSLSKARSSYSLRMSTQNHFQNPLYFLSNIALGPTMPKTTTIDDPTAGMTPEQIQKYSEGVGGIDTPEWARSILGVAININFFVFGVSIVLYGKLLYCFVVGLFLFSAIGIALASGYNFYLKKQIEDKLLEAALLETKETGQRSPLLDLGEQIGVWNPKVYETRLPSSAIKSSPDSSSSGSSSSTESSSSLENRQIRRLKARKEKT